MSYLLSDLSSGGGEYVVTLVREALLIRVEVGHNGSLNASERGVLDKHLSAHTGVDARNTAIVAGAVNVGGTETDGGEARVDPLEVVVVVCNAQLALVLCGIAVGVADKRTLPLLVC